MGIAPFRRREAGGATMNRRISLLLVGAIFFARADQFTVEIPAETKSQTKSQTTSVKTDARRYTQVRDDLCELFARVMERSVCLTSELAGLLVDNGDDRELVRVSGLLIKQLAGFECEICQVMRKIAEGVSGMSCKRLKNLEKKFLPIQSVLEKKLEKTGKNGQADRVELKKNIEKLSRELT